MPRKKSGTISCDSVKLAPRLDRDQCCGSAEAEGGSRAEMTEIMDGTPAADSGVKPGDILLQVGKTKVHEPEDVIDASFFITAGDTVPITVMRGKEKLTFNVQADFHPAAQTSSIATGDLKHQGIPIKLDSIVQRTP